MIRSAHNIRFSIGTGMSYSGYVYCTSINEIQ
jgi:hypothetical protein